MKKEQKWIRVFNKGGSDWIGRILIEDGKRIICDVIDDYVYINTKHKVAIPEIKMTVMEFYKIDNGLIDSKEIEYSHDANEYHVFTEVEVVEYIRKYYESKLEELLKKYQDNKDNEVWEEDTSIVRVRKQLETVIPFVKKYIKENNL